MKITDYLVQDEMKGEFDTSILHNKMFPVNIRLYHKSDRYRQIILNIIDYMEWHLNCHFEDYADPKGVSSANLGIPFNIIAIKESATHKFYLNPRIMARKGTVITTQSGCGSLCGGQPVSVQRNEIIDLEFYDLKGNKVIQKGITKEKGGYIIQHEINHSLGLMLSNKVKPTPSEINAKFEDPPEG